MTHTDAAICDLDHPINQRILAVSEDRIQGFVRDPIAAIAEQTQLPSRQVIDHLAAMLEAGVIRRIRQTLLTTSLARGALVAWQIDPQKLNEAFDWMNTQDPFTGHVVIRSTDAESVGSTYRLWTTVKVPPQYSLSEHCALLGEKVGADDHVIMPAKMVFALGVGHVRRKTIAPGQKIDQPAKPIEPKLVELNDEQWSVLLKLKRELTVEEIAHDLWARRAGELNMAPERFCEIAEQLDAMQVVGRFSTFLEHVKPVGEGKAVTRYNALFHWAVPDGMQMTAGREVARHVVLTHCYWREGGPAFGNVNIMAVAHGTDRDLILEHKKAIDEHLQSCNINVPYTNVFWGGRSEIKPSEIDPTHYAQWKQQMQG